MAFNAQEQEIIKAGVSSGKSRREIETALSRYRLGLGPVPQAQPTQASPKQSGLDRSWEAITGAVKTAGEVRGRVEQGEQSPISGTLQTIGGGLRAGAEVIGNTMLGIGKVLLPKAAEEAIGGTVQSGAEAVAKSDPAQFLVEKYNGLTPEQKGVVDGVLGTTEGLATLLGVGPAVRAGKTAVQATANATKSVVDRGAEALAGITQRGTAGIQEATSKAVDPVNIMQRVARVSPTKQRDFQAMTGESVGQYLVNRGIFGDTDELIQQLHKRFETSKGNVDKAMGTLPGEYKSTAFGNALSQLIAHERRVSSVGAPSTDLERVIALQKKHNGAGLTMEEFNEVKRFYERNVRVEYLKEMVPDKIQFANNVDKAMREWQFSQARQLGFKNLPALNKETQAAKQLLDDLGAEIAGKDANNLVTLTDWIVLAGGDPTAVGAFLTKKALSSKRVMSKVAEKLAPAPTKGMPKAELEAPTLDNYRKFLELIEDRATPR